MENRLFKKYRFKVYLNASHFISINGHQGNVHPHTWEFSLEILITRKDFVEFKIFENVINDFLDKYQNITLNDVDPFNAIVPTLENITDYFGSSLRPLLQDTGGELLVLEGSESPTRSYIVDYSNDSDYIRRVSQSSADSMNTFIDHMLDDIISDRPSDDPDEKW